MTLPVAVRVLHVPRSDSIEKGRAVFIVNHAVVIVVHAILAVGLSGIDP